MIWSNLKVHYYLLIGTCMAWLATLYNINLQQLRVEQSALVALFVELTETLPIMDDDKGYMVER